MRSRASSRAAGRAAASVALLVAAVAGAGCGSPDYALAWSVRRGHVGEFAIRGDAVFTIGERLAVYDAATGRQRRSTALPADLGDTTLGQLGPGAMATADSVVFGWYDFATEAGTLFCFDATTLARRWEWRIHWPWSQRSLRPTLAVIADADHVYAAAIGKDADNVFAFRLVDGTLVWSRSVEKFPAESALALAGDRLIVRSQLWARTSDWHEQLDAISLHDGRQLWRTWLIGEAKHHTGGPLIDNSHLYTTTRAGPDSGHLFVVRLADGQTRRDDVATSGAPFAKRGPVVFLGGSPPLAYDLDARRTLWRASVGYPDDAWPPMMAGGAIDAERNRVFTGDSGRFVYVLAADTGLLHGRIRLDTYARFELFSPLKALYGSYGVRRLDLHGGMLVVGTVDSSLFVFRTR